jgi:hypothetical protein
LLDGEDLEPEQQQPVHGQPLQQQVAAAAAAAVAAVMSAMQQRQLVQQQHPQAAVRSTPVMLLGQAVLCLCAGACEALLIDRMRCHQLFCAVPSTPLLLLLICCCWLLSCRRQWSLVDTNHMRYQQHLPALLFSLLLRCCMLTCCMLPFFFAQAPVEPC